MARRALAYDLAEIQLVAPASDFVYRPLLAAGAALRGRLLRRLRQVALDQRVAELPLRAREPAAVPLERRGCAATFAENLTLDDELCNVHRQRLDARAVPAPPEARRMQTPE